MSAWWQGATANYSKYEYVVYRVYDRSGRLVYIGSTRDVISRFAQHERLSWWHSLIGDVTTVSYPNGEAVLAAEEVAIQEEQPAFNVRHTTNGPVLTEADVEVALRWREQAPGNVLGGTGLLDAINAGPQRRPDGCLDAPGPRRGRGADRGSPPPQQTKADPHHAL